MKASDDPTIKAAGYVHAAVSNLGIAVELLPDDHPVMHDLAKLLKQTTKVERDVRSVWVDRHGDGNWVRR